METLSQFRVIDFSTGISGPYATKMLSDLGADIIKVEPPEGDALRGVAGIQAARFGSSKALFRYLNAGKRSVVGAPADPEIDELVSTSDLVVESFVPRQLDPDALIKRQPQLVVLSFTPYGRYAKWENRPATEFTVQAESGGLAFHGRRDQVPYQCGGRLIEWSVGVYGAAGALAALLGARKHGNGTVVDCSLLAAATFGVTSFSDTLHNLLGRPPLIDPPRIIEAPSVEPTSDGWVGFCTNTRQQFDDFLVLIERPELLADDRWAVPAFRAEHFDEWNKIVHQWTRKHTTAEIVEQAALLRIPVAPVNNAKTLLEFDHFRDRGVFVPSADGSFLQPRVPYAFDGVRPEPKNRAPGLGEHNSSVTPRIRSKAVQRGRMRLPLEGIRVIDATAFWAGPSVGQALAALGADVIHLESIQRPDGARMYVGPLYGKDRWWELGKMWMATNNSKRDMTLNMRDPKGLELAKRLIARSDVLVENFSPRVFEQFGLDSETVRQCNPQLIMVRMPAFGLTGPWRDHVGFAQTMEQISGQAWLTGHPDDQPRIPRGPCDAIAGYHATFAILASLIGRETTSKGVHIEAAMVECALNVSAAALLEYQESGSVTSRQGNRDDVAAPQGLFACKGVEQWIALSITTDEQWRSLVEVMGFPPWAKEPGLEMTAERITRYDEVVDRVGEWTKHQDLHELVSTLVSVGIPAGAATDPRTMDEHEALIDLGYYEVGEHPVAGSMPYPTIPFQFRAFDGWMKSTPPLLGQDNHAILTELGCTDAEIAELEEREIIGTTPLGL